MRMIFTTPGAIPVAGDEWKHKEWLWDGLNLMEKNVAARVGLFRQISGSDSVTEYHVGKNWGWGLRMWLWLYEHATDVEIVFVKPENLEKCLARALAEQVWIGKDAGRYASCASKLEAQIKAQIEQMEIFHVAHGKDARVLMQLS